MRGSFGLMCLLLGLNAAAAASRPDLVGQTGASADPYEDQWFDRVPPWKRVRASDVIVDQTGLGESERDRTSDSRPCSEFRPSSTDVREFIARAKPVSKRDFLHETTWSACHASGRARLPPQVDAHWSIQRYGAGYLTIAGRNHYFACESCKFVVGESR